MRYRRTDRMSGVHCFETNLPEESLDTQMGRVDAPKRREMNVGLPASIQHEAAPNSPHELGAGCGASHFPARDRVERRRIHAEYMEMFGVEKWNISIYSMLGGRATLSTPCTTGTIVARR